MISGLSHLRHTEDSGRRVAQGQAHTRASRAGVEAVAPSHAAVGFSSSVDGWRTSGGVSGGRCCLLPLHHMSK
jgi:hypothetical protein